MTKDLIEGLEIVLPNGEVINGIKNIKKDNRGFDLKFLHIGSEGTLGIVTKAQLKLFPIIQNKAMAIVAFKNIKEVLSFLSLLKSNYFEYLTSFELNSNIGLDLICEYFSEILIPFENKFSWYVIFEFSSYGNKDLEKEIETIIQKAINKKIIIDALIPQNMKQYKNIWNTRNLLNEAQKINGPSIKHDISIPIFKIPDFLRKAKLQLSFFSEENILAFGHLADGNLHYNISKPKDMKIDEFKKLYKKVNLIIFDLVHNFGGSFSAEHGIGKIKIKEFKKYSTKHEYMLKKNIKKLIDPNNIMNPGKIFG